MESRWSLKRIFRTSYNNRHETKISSWLPPVDSWDSGGTGLPFGWEAAVDKDGKTYYVNHTNKTTTYESPRKESEDEAPLPREVVLVRDPHLGFGFVAGSEKPVIVRFVTEGGPNEHKLMPGDQIMKINGEDVIKSPREHVIELIRSCKQSVTLIVCQPQSNNSTRKSALLTAAKKAKLKNNPSRVRFSEGVVINGSPLYSPSPMDSCVPFLPNVLKVFLENGQTKSFKYDSTTTVFDVLNSLNEKMSIKCSDHFSLATEHVNITRRNRLAVLDSNDALAKIAAKPGAHNLRCVFRITFVPKDAYDLLQKDPTAFEYLYIQCCNDVVQERFAPELKYDIVLRLAALHIQQHAVTNNTQGKVTVKAVERETGLEKFVPMSLLDTMKRKELRKLLSHYLKQNQSLCAPGHKQLTALQAKLHYLKIISELPSYGAKCFTTNLKVVKDSNPELALLVSPRFGVSQIACLRNMNPVTLSRIEDLASVCVSKEDEFSSNVEIRLKESDKQSLIFSLEDRDTEEFILLLKGYYRLLTEKELPVQMDIQNAWPAETVPSFHSRHTVKSAPWSYPPQMNGAPLRTLDLAMPPPQYVSHERDRNLSRSSSREKVTLSTASSPTSVDHNMNETLLERSQEDINKSPISTRDSRRCSIPPRICIDERHPGIDYQSVISMELLEDSSGDVDVDVYEAKNDEVINRISEMNRILVDAESYLFDKKTSDSSETDVERHTLKAADSLLLLTHPTTPIPSKEARIAAGEELSPSESDNDSTPNESPLHRSNPLRNSINEGHSRLRRDSSFGLHSPDLLPTVTPGNNILDILKQLQCEDIPIAEGTLYLDPDIIDLTMIPPPDTPDKESQSMTSPLDAPPTPFLDAGTIHKELEKWIRIPGPPPDDADDHGGLVAVQQNGSSATEPASTDISENYLENKRLSVDSTKVVADLDKLCEALSAMQSSNLRLSQPNAGPSSMDSFVANQTVLPPSANKRVSDDLSAFIIPPPPSSSPSTEAQNEVIARFMAAAEDMKRMFTSESGRQFSQDAPQNGFQELQQFWSEIETINPRGSDVLLGHLDALSAVADSDFHSGDSSSGYDTLTSSLTSYSDTVVSDDVDFTSIPNSAESTPVNEQPPSILHVIPSNQQPVLPRLRTTCVDDVTSPLSITSPSSTTSSDSSVIQLDGSSSDVLFGEDSQRRINMSDLNSSSSKSAFQTGSCDNLLREEECEQKKSKRLSISRSISWSSLADMENSKPERLHSETSDPMNQKPPIPPNSFQNRLRRSLNRDPLRSPVLARHNSLPHPISPTNTSTGTTPQFPVAARNGDLLHANSADPIPNSTHLVKSNGQLNGLITLPRCPTQQDNILKAEHGFPQNGCVRSKLTNGVPDPQCLDIRSSGPFQQAQKDIAAMVSHLKKISQMTSKDTTVSGSSEDKFSAAKDALVNESRQFVTSSKLFVKSAMESSEKMIENMAICVALLNRMTAISELVVLRGSPGEPVSYLVDRLKEVAVAYFYTVESAQQAVGTNISHPNMATLMQKATTLATALTSLMRTLRAMSML